MVRFLKIDVFYYFSTVNLIKQEDFFYKRVKLCSKHGIDNERFMEVDRWLTVLYIEWDGV